MLFYLTLYTKCTIICKNVQIMYNGGIQMKKILKIFLTLMLIVATFTLTACADTNSKGKT